MANFHYYNTVRGNCNDFMQLAFWIDLWYIFGGDNMKVRFKGISALFIATIIWGSAFVSQTIGMDHIGPFTFQFARCTLAVFVLSATLFFRNPHEFLRILLDKQLWIAGSLCGIALFAAASLQQVGLVHTDAGKAGFLTAMYIVLVPVLGIFLGKRPGKTILLSIALAVIGLYLLSCTDINGINPGDMMMLGCALAFSFQITLVDHYAPVLDGMALNCIQCLVCGICSVPFMLFTETVEFSAILDCSIPLLYAGALSMGVAYSLQIYGQQRLDPTVASLLMGLASVFAVIFGWLILHETLTVSELAGCALVFIAVILSQLPQKQT